MGVLLAAALIVAGTAVGVGAERRHPTAAVALGRRFMLVILYVLLPIVIFFNLAKAHDQPRQRGRPGARLGRIWRWSG